MMMCWLLSRREQANRSRPPSHSSLSLRNSAPSVLCVFAQLNATHNSTFTFSPALIQGFASFVIGGLGAFGLVSGIIVLTSAIMLQVNPSSSRRTWGVLILVLSVLSFLGTGGFVAGAILGIIGGIKALTWKPPTN